MDSKNRAPGENPVPNLDPRMLQAARDIYWSYRNSHAGSLPQPIGIVMDRKTYRGELIFNRRPALLPMECFIPLEHIYREG